MARVTTADHYLVRSRSPQAVTCPGAGIGQSGEAADIGAPQERTQQLGLRLGSGDLNHHEFVRADHR